MKFMKKSWLLKNARIGYKPELLANLKFEYKNATSAKIARDKYIGLSSERFFLFCENQNLRSQNHSDAIEIDEK